MEATFDLGGQCLVDTVTLVRDEQHCLELRSVKLAGCCISYLFVSDR